MNEKNKRDKILAMFWCTYLLFVITQVFFIVYISQVKERIRLYFLIPETLYFRDEMGGFCNLSCVFI